MPESIAVLFVVTICLGGYLFAKVQATDPARRDPVAERKQLLHRYTWLNERLKRAENEAWDDQIVSQMKTQLAETTLRLNRSS